MLLRPFLNNSTSCASYLFGCGTHATLAVVDPHADLVDDYLATAAALGAPIVAVFETHVQADHVSGLPELVARSGATAYLPAETGAEFEHVALADGDVLELGNTLVTAIATPGHLAGRFPYDGYFYDGGWHLLARTPPNTRPMRWPSGWTVIEALARDHRLRASPSTAGAAAATLLRQLGSLEAVSAILSTNVVTELHRLGERRGMSWFRRRARDLAATAGADEVRLSAIETRLDDLRLRAFEGEGNDLTVESVGELLGRRDRASAWLRWALERGLLVQGIEVECRRCGAQSWRSVQEMAPPVVCRGCGATIERPFPVDQLKFRYRASESLLRVVEADAMAHILTLRWWCELFADPFNKGSYLYGAYPGVDFRSPDGETVGEADVLLVLADGALVPGECKRTSAGLNDMELGKLDRLADALGSPWTFVATLSPSRDCDATWKQAGEADGGTRPRLVLTADQLYDESVVPALGEDAFAWREQTSNDDAKRDKAWKAQLGDRIEYLGEERDPDAYLFKEFDEESE